MVGRKFATTNIVNSHKKEEDVRSSYRQLNNDFNGIKLKAHWENKTDTKIKQNLVKDKYDLFVAEQKTQLEARRKKLADLLQNEAAAYHQELDSMRETNESRQEKMLQRARDLKSAREQERQKFVELSLEKKFRDESEELREYKSKELVKKYQIEQLGQMKERDDKRSKDKEEQRHFDDLWEQDRLRKLKREQDDAQRRKEQDKKTIAVVNKQFGEIQQKKSDQEQRTRDDAQALSEKYDRERIEEEKKRIAEKDFESQRRSDLDRLNEQKRVQKEQETRKVKEEDYKFVQDTIERERKVLEKEIAAKESRKADALNYRSNLKAQMSREQEDDAILDDYRRKQLDQDFQKQEAKRKKEEDAREKLKQQVLSSRVQQIDKKEFEKQRLLDEKIAERERVQEDLRKHAEEEKEKLERIRREKFDYQTTLIGQMTQKRPLSNRIPSVDVEDARKKEEERKQRVAAELQNTVVSTQKNYGRKSANWGNL